MESSGTDISVFTFVELTKFIHKKHQNANARRGMAIWKESVNNVLDIIFWKMVTVFLAHLTPITINIKTLVFVKTVTLLLMVFVSKNVGQNKYFLKLTESVNVTLDLVELEEFARFVLEAQVQIQSPKFVRAVVQTKFKMEASVSVSQDLDC